MEGIKSFVIQYPAVGTQNMREREIEREREREREVSICQVKPAIVQKA
jgi:hypothetical protein